MTTTCCHCERSEAISRRIVLCRWGLLRRSAPRNDETAMIAYAIRRIALMLPTLFAIMVVNFFIVQAAPVGPIQQMISNLKGTDAAATERVSGAGGELRNQPSGGGPQDRGAPRPAPPL